VPVRLEANPGDVARVHDQPKRVASGKLLALHAIALLPIPARSPLA